MNSLHHFMEIFHMVKNRWTKTIAAAAAAAILAVAAINPASAHFGVSASSTAAGAYSLLTFSSSHGCDGSAWNKVAIQIPESVQVARPGMKAGWTIETSAEETTNADGEAAERITSITYTASGPEFVVPEHFYDQFLVQVQLPETVGEVVYFPLVQTCEVGENAWIEIPAEGQDAEELESPAPSITITEAVAADE
jgi:uncharacterized protein YcnI